MLVPRVIASGRLWQRSTEVELCVEDLPECAVAPFTLTGVTACSPGEWELVRGPRGRVFLRVTLRLMCQVRDANCCCFTGHSAIAVDVPLHTSFPIRDLWRTHVIVQPTVWLSCVRGVSDDGCFQASLDVLVDVFLARWEPSSDGITVPCRPDLPLNLPRSFPVCNRC